MFGNSIVKIPFIIFIHSAHYWIWNVCSYIQWRLLSKMYIHLDDVKSLILELILICISNFCTNNFMLYNSFLLLSKLTPLIIPCFITELKWAKILCWRCQVFLTWNADPEDGIRAVTVLRRVRLRDTTYWQACDS